MNNNAHDENAHPLNITKPVITFLYPFCVFVVVLVILYLNYQNKVVSAINRGVASYNLSYNLVKPNYMLINELFTSQINKFDNRDIIVLIGNSLIAGAGTIDKNYLNKEISEHFNVINAGLGGEYLTSSVSLAIYGLDHAIRNNPNRFIHIFVVYNVERFYVHGDYWVFGNAIAKFCHDKDIEPYIYNCKELRSQYNSDLLSQMISTLVVGGLSCAFSPDTFRVFVTNYTFRCENLFETIHKEGDFIKQHDNPLWYASADLSYVLGMISWVFDEDQRKNTLAIFRNRIGNLTNYLDSRGMNNRYRVNVILLSENNHILNILLKSEEKNKYDRARQDFLSDMALVIPNSKVFFFNQVNPEDYLDVSHLKETGQSKLANFIVNSTLSR